MPLADILAIDRETLVFAKKETTFGTLIKPVAADQVLLVGDGAISQDRAFLPDKQKRNTYSARPPFPGRYNVGAFNFPFYIKPSGALGTKPDGAQLLEGLFGRETVTGSTKVEYFLLRTTDTRPSLTIWAKVGHWVYMLAGVLVNEGRFPIRAGNEDEAIGRCSVSGFFTELRWTGTDELAADPALGATSITVLDASKFSVGSYIKKGTDDNAGAGYQVTAVNLTTNVLTITPGTVADWALGDKIEPWLPAGTESGSVVHGRLGTVARGATTLPLVGGEIVVTNGIKLLDNEKNSKDFADRFIHATERTVDVSAEVFFTHNMAKYFSEHTRQIQADVVATFGDTAAKRYKLTAKNVELKHPGLSGNEEKILKMEGKAFASASYDDELVMLLD